MTTDFVDQRFGTAACRKKLIMTSGSVAYCLNNALRTSEDFVRQRYLATKNTKNTKNTKKQLAINVLSGINASRPAYALRRKPPIIIFAELPVRPVGSRLCQPPKNFKPQRTQSSQSNEKRTRSVQLEPLRGWHEALPRCPGAYAPRLAFLLS